MTARETVSGLAKLAKIDEKQDHITNSSRIARADADARQADGVFGYVNTIASRPAVRYRSRQELRWIQLRRLRHGLYSNAIIFSKKS